MMNELDRKCWKCGGAFSELNPMSNLVYQSFPPQYAHADCLSGEIRVSQNELLSARKRIEALELDNTILKEGIDPKHYTEQTKTFVRVLEEKVRLAKKVAELEAKFNVAWDALDDIATSVGDYSTAEIAKEAMEKIEIQCVRYEEVK